MIPESAIIRECVNKTFARARSVARNLGFVYNRRCDYEPDSTIIRACVESTSWSDYPYDVRVTLDEAQGSILDYECTCPAHMRYPGMCKHAAGLVLIYNEHPESFKGHTATHTVSTSRTIAALLRETAARSAVTSAHSERANAGSIHLELTLEAANYEQWAIGFKIGNAAASYVVKNLDLLVSRIDNAEYFDYGKKLGFTHTMEAFDRQSQKVLEFLEHTMATNSAWFKEHDWQYTRNTRYMYLSDAGVIELLELYKDTPFMFKDPTDVKGKTHRVTVVQADPPLSLRIEELEGGGWQLHRGSFTGFIHFGNTLYTWDDRHFFLCSPEMTKAAPFLTEVYERGEDQLMVSEKDMPAFAGQILPVLQLSMQVEAPPKVEAMKPQPCRLEFYLDAAKGGAECEPKAVYGEDVYSLFDSKQQPDKPLRDAALERVALDTVARFLPLAKDTKAYTGSSDDMARLLFHGVDELGRIGDVFTTDAFRGKKAKTRPSVSTGLSIKSNLVNVDISSNEMSPDEIAALLGSYQAKKKYHLLKDGTFINLEKEAGELKGLEELDAIAQELGLTLAQLASGQVDLSAYHAFVLDSLAEDEGKDESFRAFVDALSSKKGTEHKLPQELEGVLRSYQEEGFQWMNLLADLGLCGILADEMGLGKSLQVISVLLHQREQLKQAPALVVCPASLVYNWVAEFRKWAPSMQVRALAGSPEERAATREEEGVEAFVTSYDTLRIDIEHLQERSWSFQIIDEAQYIKNHNTQAAKAVKAVEATHRIACTGTPIENRLSELWSIFDYLMPGMLGPYKRFRERYEQPILGGDEEVSARLRAKVGPFILRRLKADVLKDLPDKIESCVYAQMDDEQRRLYDAHEMSLLMSLTKSSDEELATSKIAVLAELTKLRQICCDPKLLYEDYKGSAAKLDIISELVQQSVDSGQKVLVFSQFTSYLDLIAEQMDAHGWSYYTITGATPKKRRLELVDAFNADDTPVFLISLKAGGTGLNLVGASIVIHADPWWNAAAQNQATDRAHRIGQARDVSVFKVIAAGTIEERIVELQEAKTNLAESILKGEGTSLGSLSREDLVSLLRSE